VTHGEQRISFAFGNTPHDSEITKGHHDRRSRIARVCSLNRRPHARCAVAAQAGAAVSDRYVSATDLPPHRHARPNPCGYYCSPGRTAKGRKCSHSDDAHYSIDGEAAGCMTCEQTLEPPTHDSVTV
jgi:hypothetical protein